MKKNLSKISIHIKKVLRLVEKYRIGFEANFRNEWSEVEWMTYFSIELVSPKKRTIFISRYYFKSNSRYIALWNVVCKKSSISERNSPVIVYLPKDYWVHKVFVGNLSAPF